MSGIEIVGLISAVITIVETSSKLHELIAKYRDLPQALVEVGRKLPLVRDVLETVRRQIERGSTNDPAASIKAVVEGCGEKARRLKDLLLELASNPGASRLARYQLAVRRLGRGSQVESLIKGLLDDVQLLAAHRAVRAATEAQVELLLEAKRTLSEEPPSTPDAVQPVIVTHHVQGVQANDPGMETRGTVAGDHEVKECRRALFRTDPLDDLKQLKRKKGERATHTCEWILDTEILRSWLGRDPAGGAERARPVLWLHGNPGTGKSTMSIYLVEELLRSFRSTPERSLAFFICDSLFDTRRTATSILRGLIWQLTKQHPSLLHQYVLPEYEERGPRLFDSFDALWSIFLDLATDKASGSKFCIIDALDECEQEAQVTLLEQLRESPWGDKSSDEELTLSILITSRPYTEIEEYLGQPWYTNKNLASFPESRRDVEKFIADRVSELSRRKRYTEAVAAQVSKILTEKAEATFLWIGLAYDELVKIPSKDAVTSLQSLPKGLHRLYENLHDRAMQETGGGDAFKLIMGFVIVARQPLTVLELSRACRLHQNQGHEDRLQFMKDEITSCRLMVIVQDQKVLLLHQSVKDFLLDSVFSAEYVLEAHALLSRRCVDSLIRDCDSQDDPHSGCAGDNSDDESYHSFQEYSGQFWGSHAQEAKDKFMIGESQAEFFTVESRSRQQWLESLTTIDPYPRLAAESSILHVAAKYNLSAIVKFILAGDSYGSKIDSAAAGPGLAVYDDAEYLDRYGHTPLELAAYLGNTDVFSTFLWHDATRVDSSVLLATAVRSSRNTAVLVDIVTHRFRDTINVTEDTLFTVARKDDGSDVLARLLDSFGDRHVIISDWSVQVNPENGEGKPETKPFAGRKRISMTVAEAVIGLLLTLWPVYLIEHFLSRRREMLTITKFILEGTERNELHREKLLGLLLRRQNCRVTAEAAILIAKRFNEGAMKALLDRTPDLAASQEDMLKAAAANLRYGKNVLEGLLDKWGDEAVITEKILESARANYMQRSDLVRILRNRQVQLANCSTREAPGEESGESSGPRGSSAPLGGNGTYDEIRLPDKIALELRRGTDILYGGEFSHDGAWFAASSDLPEGLVIIWDASTWSTRLVLLDTEVLNTSSRSLRLAWSPDDSLIVRCDYQYTRLWDAQTGSLVKRIGRNDLVAASCVWAADGQSFVIGGRGLSSWNTDGEFICDWDTSLSYIIRGLCSSSRWLAAFDDKAVSVHNAATREVEFSLTKECALNELCMSQDGRYLLIGRSDGVTELFDIALRSPVRKFLGAGVFGVESIPTNCAFGGINDFFVVRGDKDGGILIWDTASGDIVGRLPEHEQRVHSISWNPRDPYMIASSGFNGHVTIWSNEELKTPNPKDNT